jgi:hypothetical protein
MKESKLDKIPLLFENPLKKILAGEKWLKDYLVKNLLNRRF